MAALLGSNVKMYGPVHLGERVIIEHNVVIGHPSAIEVGQARLKLGAEFGSEPLDLDAFYAQASLEPTFIGDDSVIRSGTVIYSGVRIGRGFECGHHVVIREGCCLGDEVYLKSHTHLMRSVRMGDACRISAIIADNTHIGDRVSVFGTLTHRTPKRSPQDQGPWIGPTVGDDCLIGRGAVVLGPCEIGHGATVGANAFVDFDVAPGALIVAPRGVDLRREGRG